MQAQRENSGANMPDSQGRRRAMKKIAAGVGVLAGCSVIPEQWVRPVVGQISLPAHAATSGEVLVEEETTDPAAEVQADATEPTAEEEYNTTEVYPLLAVADNNKRFTWLDQTGAFYGGQIKFVFSDGCGELIVPDAAVTYGADGTTSNHDQAYYFCGTDFEPGTREYNAGKASVFGPPGCPAETVTLYYNK